MQCHACMYVHVFAYECVCVPECMNSMHAYVDSCIPAYTRTLVESYAHTHIHITYMGMHIPTHPCVGIILIHAHCPYLVRAIPTYTLTYLRSYIHECSSW